MLLKHNKLKIIMRARQSHDEKKAMLGNSTSHEPFPNTSRLSNCSKLVERSRSSKCGPTLDRIRWLASTLCVDWFVCRSLPVTGAITTVYLTRSIMQIQRNEVKILSPKSASRLQMVTLLPPNNCLKLIIRDCALGSRPRRPISCSSYQVATT